MQRNIPNKYQVKLVRIDKSLRPPCKDAKSSSHYLHISRTDSFGTNKMEAVYLGQPPQQMDIEIQPDGQSEESSIISISEDDQESEDFEDSGIERLEEPPIKNKKKENENEEAD